MFTYASALGSGGDTVWEGVLFINWKKAVEGLLAKNTGVVEALVAIQVGDQLHLFGRQLEVENRQVLAQPLGASRLGYHRRAALHTPAQHDLGRRFAMPLGNGHDARFAEHR